MTRLGIGIACAAIVAAISGAAVVHSAAAPAGQSRSPAQASAQAGVQPAAEGGPGAAAPGSAGDSEEHLTPSVPTIIGTGKAAFGVRLFDGQAATVYVFSNDRARLSHCSGACALQWLPVRSLGAKPRAGAGATPSAVGSIIRADGSEQVTYNGYPLYYYAGDGRPGDTLGQGRNDFGGRWSATPPSSKQRTSNQGPVS